MMMIPIFQPTLHDFEQVVDEFRQVWNSGQVTTGVFTRRFEAAVEDKLRVPHAIMVQSCTAGLMLVLRALDLKGEVILPAFTWTATAHAVVWNGLTPVFADIYSGTCTLDPRSVEKTITDRTAAIMPVNVFGCPPDYEAFQHLAQKYDLRLVYDSAQGLGSKFQTKDGAWHYAGNFGEAEVFSLSPTKVVSAMEGGLITTHNADLAQKLRQMRDYGKSSDGEDIEWLGLSARVSEINAIVGRHNFKYLDGLVAWRAELIADYQKAFVEVPRVNFQQVPTNCLSSGNYFILFISNYEGRSSRDKAHNYLKERGIQTKKYFYPAVHRQKVYAELGKPYRQQLPVTEKAAAEGLALPLYTHMAAETCQLVTTELLHILG